MPENRRVHFIPPKPVQREKRVGIYCRVSSNCMEQLNSLTNQVSALTRLTAVTPNWLLVDTYIDIASGKSVAKTNKLWIVLIAGAILGFFISIAEPGLLVLANQVESVTSGQIASTSILIVVSLGIALMLALGFLRIFYNIPLFKMLMALYLTIFLLAILASREFLAIAFDASGSTTGILAVPFILSLSVGISKLKKDTKASGKDSFGLIAIASTGAIILEKGRRCCRSCKECRLKRRYHH